MKAIAIFLMLVSAACADNCRNVVRQNVIVNDVGLAVVPFAIATPVAVVAQGSPIYSYREASQAYAPRAAAQSQSIDEQEYAEFKAWRASRVQAASIATALSKSCAKCHESESPNGKFRLSTATSDQLLHAVERVADGTMPPKSEPRPSGQDIGKIMHELATARKVVKPAVVTPQSESK